MALEPVIMRRFERLQTQTSRLGFDFIDLNNRARNSSGFFTVLTTVCVVSMRSGPGYGRLYQHWCSCGLHSFAGQVVQPLLRGINHWTDMQRINHDHGQASALFELPCDNLSANPDIPVFGNIQLQRTSYRSNSDVVVPLHNLDLKINAGETIAFEGSDGSGRTTLSRLISGGLEPTSGSVLIDRHDLYGPDHRGLRNHIAYVGNDAEMFSGTILQN